VDALHSRGGVGGDRPPSQPNHLSLRITYEIKPGIFDEKRGIAALLIKNSGFYLIFNHKQGIKPIYGEAVWRRHTASP